MTIAVKRYYSGMNAGAPSLTGQAGSLITLLDACLKDGFQTKSVVDPSGAVQTAGTATVTTTTAHGYGVNDVVVLSGANESAWNNEFRVLTAATNSFTFAIGSGTTSPATGTISVKIAPLGWTKPFSGTNKAAYFPAAQYVQCYLRVQDDSSTPTSASGRWAKIRGYETMSDVDTGTGLFPTSAIATNALSLFKSSTSDSTARSWWMVGDGGIFYLGVMWHASYLTLTGCYAFGDIASLRAGDAYSSFIVAESAGTDTLSSNPGTSNVFAYLGALSSTQTGKYLARSYTQIGSAVAAGMMGDQGISSFLGYSGLTYPHPVDNGLLFAPVAVVENNVLRSRALPGLYQVLHTTPLDYLAVVTGLPDFPGRTFQAFDTCYTSNRAQVLIDITGPWR
jgi:hypothetical protein